MLSIGLMSGTSMDGIDAALIKTDGEAQIEECGHVSVHYEPPFRLLLKSIEYAVRMHQGDVKQAALHFLDALNDFARVELSISTEHIPQFISTLSQFLSEKKQTLSFDDIVHHATFLHGEAVQCLLEKTKLSPEKIDVVGYHGQTLFHRPSTNQSVIVGDGQALADHVGITVVNDFRRNDMLHGGQGAPFAPLYHQALAVRDQCIPLVVVNCGGIANMTFIVNDSPLDLIALDTGAGNGLIDQLVRKRTNGRENMDENGRYGKRGRVHDSVLSALYTHSIIQEGCNFFDKLPPKSLDIGDLKCIPELDSLSLEDACATLEAFTADSIVRSVEWMNSSCPSRWVLAGGGWNNPVIRYELEHRLKKIIGKSLAVCTADEMGWNGQALEAQIFGYFAVRCLKEKPLSVPGTTGVSKPVTGGKVYRVRTMY